MRRIPGIISDIDGVLVRGKYGISGSRDALSKIRSPLNQIFSDQSNPFKSGRIPFVCLTNGGGMLEKDKADSLNSILNLSSDIAFSNRDMLLNFSPLRSVLSSTRFREQRVLIAGVGNIEDIASSCGLLNFITIEEFCALQPSQVSHFKRIRMEKQEAFDIVASRISEKAAQDLISQDLPLFDGVYVLNDPVYWEDCIQVILNQVYYLSNTSVSLQQVQKRQIEICTVNNDITYADTFQLNRLAFGPFTFCLQNSSQALFNDSLDIKIYGKPSKLTYDYAKNQLSNLSDDPIGNVYMIGDNPKSDIRGANENGCISILVKY